MTSTPNPKTMEKRIQQEEMRQAAQTMDKLAEKTDLAWSGADEVLWWRRNECSSFTEMS